MYMYVTCVSMKLSIVKVKHCVQKITKVNLVEGEKVLYGRG